jgi:toxin FitB
VAKTFALDSSCMIAAVSTWHEHHEAAAAEIERRLGLGERLVVVGHALVEAYAVLTRLPAGHRLAPADAWILIKGNFVDRAKIVALESDGYRDLLAQVASDGIAGGRTYDRLIGKCANHAKVDALVTLNPRHFDPAPDGVTVIDPLKNHST